MKILMVSMTSIHFFRWTEQLRDAGHQVYWIDVFDSGIKNPKIDFVDQTVGWRNRINFNGRYFLKEKAPKVYNIINIVNQRKLSAIFLQKFLEIEPDIVHSFVLFSACTPILNVMRQYSDIPWIYSAWGNDLFYLQHNKNHLKGIKNSLSRIDYMFADCERDYKIAIKHGFKGKYLGTYPTGGGYDISFYNSFLVPNQQRKTILIKGYQHEFGRCNSVLNAIKNLKEDLRNFKIIVFAAHKEVFEYLESEDELREMDNLKVVDHLLQDELLKMMGNSLIYIGNSISDGMPNTLLEAIVMGVFPIQSNPGGATEEIIQHSRNGFLIENPEDEKEIQFHLQNALNNIEFIEEAVAYNNKYVRPKLEREYIKKQVIEKYALVESELKN